MKLALENANKDCKRLLRALRNPSLVEMTETCNRVGSVTYKNEAFAAALATALQTGNRACSHCGRPGHFKRNCPERGSQVSTPSSRAALSLFGICPRCRRGRHHASHCRSKYDADGRPLSGNRKSSAKRACSDTNTSSAPSRPEPGETAASTGLAHLTAKTPGSAGVDVTTAASVTITDETVHKIPLSIRGPLGNNFSALLLGHSSTTSQGLFVLPGVVDADFTGQVLATLWTPSPPEHVPAGSRIAQLIPFQSAVPEAEQTTRGDGGFGSTGEPEIFWTQQIQPSRPTLTCHLRNVNASPEQVTLKGMVDTRADVTIISASRWPRTRGTVSVNTGLMGIGGMPSSQQSAHVIQGIRPEEQAANIPPFVVDVPLSLWGQDVLCSWGVTIGTSAQSQHF